tara:strand:- start:6808 stop:9282 length:2475 start_codon:yes stop_codon:yes gene_type:complete
MKVRLSQENGDVIPLDATSIDIIVERTQSNFAIPLFDAKRMGIDLNQASVTVEVQGVFSDDLGQTASAQAVATLAFDQPQMLVNWLGDVPQDGVPGVLTSSSFNLGGAIGGGAYLDVRSLGNEILKHWDNKYIDFPLAYWTDAGQGLNNPVTAGLQLWLKADSITGVLPGDRVPTWFDSSGFGRHARQTTTLNQPTFRNTGVGPASVVFDGINDHLSVSHSIFFNSEEFTVFCVAKADGTGTEPVFSSVAGATSSNNAKGFAVVMNRSNRKTIGVWNEGNSTDNVTSHAETGVFNGITNAQIVTYTMDDTTGDAQSNIAKIFINGEIKDPVADAQENASVGYIPNDSVDLVIGKMDNDAFKGEICEILIYNTVLSEADREQVEGYLSYKWNIRLVQGHEHDGGGFGLPTSIRVKFDASIVASRQEPYGFLNAQRDTGMTVSSGGGSTTLTVTGGVPNQWLEPTENQTPQRLLFKRVNVHVYNTTKTDFLYATVLTATSTKITVRYDTPGTVVNGDKVLIADLRKHEYSSQGAPLLVIPIKNADTFDQFAAPDKATGPSFPTYEDGSARDNDTGTERTDEYLAWLLSTALTNPGIIFNQDVDELGNKSLAHAFDITVGEAQNGHQCLLTITQKYASSLGQLSGVIATSLNIGQMPVTQGFSGGKSGTAGSKSGRAPKSAGDKAQDLLGILANSNNYASNSDIGFATDFIKGGTDFIANQILRTEYNKGDYIRGIQIPYLSHQTKGKNLLDSHVAQRNFFLTTEGSTAGKLSSINRVHSSTGFSHAAEGHLKNGISGLVVDMVIHREAEMKAYDFSLKFMAADIIL